MDIGKRIKERRQELGLSVDELAHKLGKNRSTVYRYENGYIENMPLDILEPIAKALQTTPAILMGWEQEQIDTASRQITDKNAFLRSYEPLMDSFLEEISEMVLASSELQRISNYAHMMKKSDLKAIADYFHEIYELELTEDEIKQVYQYAQFIKSKRNT